MIERYALFAARRARHLYRYVTGNPTCLSFVRSMFTASAVGRLASIVLAFRNGLAPYASLDLVTWAAFMLATGPAAFQAAASNDRRTAGADIAHREFLPRGFRRFLTAYLSVSLLFDIAGRTQLSDIVADVSAVPFVLAMWAICDRDGGQGERTLTGDVRRLISQAVRPAVAGSQLVPVEIPTL